MKKLVLATLLVSMLCVSAHAGSDPDLAGKQVLLILKNYTNPFWGIVKTGAEASAAKYGIEVTALAPLKPDNNEEQTHMVEQGIVSGTDLIIIIPADTMGIIPAMQKAHEEGVPVVNLNTRIGDESLAETFVATENVDIGYQTVKRLIELMGGEGEIIIIEGVPAAQTSVDRTKGAVNAIAEHPGIKLVAQQPGDFNRAKAMDTTQNLLQAHPNVKAFYCCNDEMALGTVAAIDAAGKTGKILVAGTDGNADARKAIKDGLMQLTCDSDPYNQGYQAMEAAVRVFKGEKLPPMIRLDIKVVGKEDVQ